tara:strand:+ start:6989 stop:8644 length:1656 start_codon:yes stop_codon:yes gene_type:complete
MDKKVIDKLYELYEPKENITFDSLLDLISEQMSIVVQEEDEDAPRKFSAARAYKTILKSFQAPTEQAGKIGSTERIKFQKYISRNIKGATLGEKINSINAIVEGVVNENARISDILSALGAVKMLQQTLDDFNESTAGFLFEAFLSGLLRGKQVTERVGGTLPIEDCMFFVDPKTGQGGQPVSLKLLNPRTLIEGSLENLLGFFRRDDIAVVAEQKGIEYIVAVKTLKNELDVYSFNIKPSNFFNWIDEKYFNFHGIEMEGEDNLMEAKSLEDVGASKEMWERAFLLRAPMMGLDPRQVEFNYQWNSVSEWKKIIPRPATSRKSAEAVAEIILSQAGKDAFEKWTQADLRLPSNLEAYQVPPELEQEFRSDDPAVRQAAAVNVAKYGVARRSAYLDSILGTGEKFRESAIHVQRWFAANTEGDQATSSDVVSYLHGLVKDGNPEGIKKWAATLQGRLKKPQFHIQPIKARSYGTLYGTIDVNKRKIYRVLQKYSKQLEGLVAPLYEELESLSSFINGYYMQNRVGDAYKASDSAKRLVDYTNRMAEKTEKD